MTERFRGKPDGERTSSRDAAKAPQAGGEQPDVDAFLRQPRLSLTDEYWRPVDSLIPVRLTDMRDETAPAPSSRRKVRVLDAVVAAVGLAAAALLVVVLHKDDAQPKARVVQKRTELRVPQAIAATTRVVPPAPRAPALPAPAATPAQASIVDTAAPASTASTAVQASTVRDDQNASTSAPAVASIPPASASAGEVGASTSEPTQVKKRKRKRADHAPPTASFPDP